MNPKIIDELDFEYCHRDFAGKVLRKLSIFILYLFNGNSFELRLINRINKIVKKKRKVDSRIKYFYYLLCIGRFNINYTQFLANSRISQAIDEKVKWAKFVCDYSESVYEIKSAKDYLYLLGKYGLSGKVKYATSFNIIPGKNKKISNQFYLFGPNSDNEPKQKYRDSTIVFLKDVNFDISHFNDSIMLLNWIYYQRKVRNNLEKRRIMLKKYGKVFVSSLYPIDDLDFSLSAMPFSTTLGGAQGLGRSLYYLITKYGRCSCIIEGFDFWLRKETFAKYYPTLNRVNNQIEEKNIVTALADHDAVYNFLFVKEMLNHIDIIDSLKFLEYINMPVDQYIKKLLDQRDFSLLRS